MSLVLCHINNSTGKTYLYYEYFFLKHFCKLRDCLILSSYDKFDNFTLKKLIRIRDINLIYLIFRFFREIKSFRSIVIFYEFSGYTNISLIGMVLLLFFNKLIFKKPVIFIYHGPYLETGLPSVDPRGYLLYRLFHFVIKRLISYYIVFSDSHKWKLANLGIKNVVVLPFGKVDLADLNELEKQVCVNEEKIDLPNIYILNFGVLAPRKNIGRIVLNFLKYRYNKFSLLIAGSKSKFYKNLHEINIILNFKKIIEKYNIYILDTFIPDCLALKLYRNALAVVLPYDFDVTTSGVLSLALAFNHVIIAPLSNLYFRHYIYDSCLFKDYDENFEELMKKFSLKKCIKTIAEIPISRVAFLVHYLLTLLESRGRPSLR